MNSIKQASNLKPNKLPAALSPGLLWFVLILGLFVCAASWRIAVQSEERVAIAQFHADTNERSLLIRKQLETAAAALEDLASMYAVTNVITREQFTRFVAPILARDPALRALSWNPVITDANRAAHESALRESGLTDYRITQRSAEGEIETATPREQYVVVAAIEPFEHNESVLGFDTASEKTRRRALERARDTASLSIAAPIVLVQAQGESPSALGFLPRYRSGSSIATVEQRQANLQGYFVVVVDIAQTIAAALSNLNDDDIELKILTTAPGQEAAELFVSDRFSEGDSKAATLPFGKTPRLRRTTSLTWGGHEIDLHFAASESYLAAGKTWLPWGVLLAAMALTALSFTIVYVLRGRAVAIAQEVAERTRELGESNRVLEAEVVRRNEVEKRLKAYRHDLEREVAARTSELNATTNQLRAILESEPECVKIITHDGKLEDMNAAGLAMIESDSIETARGCNVYALIDEEYRDAFIDLNRRVIAGESGTLEFKLHGLKGGTRWVDTNAVPLANPQGGPNRHLAITRDITGKKAAAEEKARMEAQLLHTQKLESIGIMAGGIAHDFNNLLQVIISHSENTLADPSIKDRTRQSLEASQSAAIDAAKLCNQMLTYAGQSQPEMHPINLPELVESIANLLEVSHSKNAEFELVFESEEELIDGDDAQLRQVVMNLVTNASEAIGDQPGRIVVTIRNEEVASNIDPGDWVGAVPSAGNYIVLEVADDGEGMHAKTREKMFDPFFTTKFSGRGLGLSSTLGIIKSHQGFLKVVTEVGQGTCITILFPVSTADQQSAPAPLNLPTKFNETVLLVDDEQALRNIGKVMLQSLGCRVLLAANGEEAVSLFAEHQDAIDIVLLDLTMPRMNGNEACTQMRQIRPDIAVIFCSGYAQDALRPDADSPAYTGFLHKPYLRNDLVTALKEGLNGHAHASA